VAHGSADQAEQQLEAEARTRVRDLQPILQDREQVWMAFDKARNDRPQFGMIESVGNHTLHEIDDLAGTRRFRPGDRVMLHRTKYSQL
jgi:hypothetical protein